MSDLKDQEKPCDNVEEEKIIATSVTDFMEKLKSCTADTKTLASNYLYRGLPNSCWSIKSTDQIRLDKNVNKKIHTHFEKDDPIANKECYNRALVQYFNHEFSNDSTNLHILNSDLEILAQLRHYNAATALIDFSRSPLVALWFACQEYQKEEEE